MNPDLKSTEWIQDEKTDLLSVTGSILKNLENNPSKYNSYEECPL